MTLTKILVLICLCYLKCTKFDQLILRKIIKIVAIRCQIFRLKCTKFDFGWGSVPDPAGGAYSAPPDPLIGSRGLTSIGRKRRGREWEKGKGMGRERKEKGEEERGGEKGERKETPQIFT